MTQLTFIVALPLIGFLFNGILHRFIPQKISGAIACLLPALAFLLTLQAAHHVFTHGPMTEELFTWASFGELNFPLQLYMDGLSAIMTLVVCGIGTLIHYYSTGYMSHDEGYRRYFAYLNLFLFFMLLLVLGKSLLLLFVGWEGVGLASYLLIGFWFKDPEKVIAGKKAFIVNRIGDAGFLIGIFLLFNTIGTLDLVNINQWFNSQNGDISSFMINIIGLALFVGATGKSAQIPLYVWLPDAMAGPTPVSALIHAATMVTAGVYMIARLSGLYIHADVALTVIAIIGATTALLAASIGMVQRDIKKVLAYSTVSQLGLMFLALGVGAFQAAVFHLFTHAFFKACLFLAAGSVIHALHEEQDIFKMGGLFKRIPITAITFLIATISIAGIPPFAGFFSKDEILWSAFASTRGHFLLWGIGSLTALMTSFYMFRLFFITFLGKTRYPHPEKIHEAPFSMTSVLSILALGSMVVGFLGVPTLLGQTLGIENFFEKALRSSVALSQLQEYSHGTEYIFMISSILVALLGLFIAYFLYAKTPNIFPQISKKFLPIHQTLFNKYYIDEFYQLVINRPLQFLAQTCIRKFFDTLIIDGFLHFCANAAKTSSGFLVRLQNGRLQYYLLFVFLGLCLALSWSLYYV